ncbi:hypothetical protein GQR58_017098 [Nymphon striatum]|nr:hypothetical protein GQR58_017098 [Nymphon striatum]
MVSSNARYDNVDNVSDTLSSSSEISEDEIDLSSCEDYCEEIGGWGKCVEPYKFQPLKSVSEDRPSDTQIEDIYAQLKPDAVPTIKTVLSEQTGVPKTRENKDFSSVDVEEENLKLDCPCDKFPITTHVQLQPSSTYQFIIECQLESGSKEKTAKDAFEIKTFNIPEFGQLLIEPSEGEALKTNFTISALNFHDKVTNVPLVYTFGYRFNLSSDKIILGQVHGPKSAIISNINLPNADKGLYIFVEFCNTARACSSTEKWIYIKNTTIDKEQAMESILAQAKSLYNKLEDRFILTESLMRSYELTFETNQYSNLTSTVENLANKYFSELEKRFVLLLFFFKKLHPLVYLTINKFFHNIDQSYLIMIKLDGDFNKTVLGREDDFKEYLRQQLSKKLNVHPSQIEIVELTEGSIDIVFKIQSSSENPMSAEEATQKLKELIQSGQLNLKDLDNNELQILGLKSDKTVVKTSTKQTKDLLPVILGVVLSIACLIIVLIAVAAYFMKKKQLREQKIGPERSVSRLDEDHIPTYQSFEFEPVIGKYTTPNKKGSIADKVFLSEFKPPHSPPGAFSYQKPEKNEVKNYINDVVNSTFMVYFFCLNYNTVESREFEENFDELNSSYHHDLFPVDGLQEFLKATENQKMSLPGYHYFSKITRYIDEYYDIGELYMEFVKDGCTRKSDESCATCSRSGWIRPQMKIIPRPFPDESTFKYKSVFESPTESSEGVFRRSDYFMPRAQIKTWVTRKKLELSEEHVEEFSKKFIVPFKLVNAYLDHLKHLQYTKELRSHKLKPKHIHERKCSSLKKVIVTGKALLHPIQEPVDSSEDSENNEDILLETYDESEESESNAESSSEETSDSATLDSPVKI